MRECVPAEGELGRSTPTQYYVTLQGQTPKVFDPNDPPAITTTTARWDWTIENRALETHAFHMYQIHFLLMEVDGKPGSHKLLDTITVPFWDGQSAYHTVKGPHGFSRPGNRGNIRLYLPHSDHEDLGMMAKIQVNAAQ